MVKSIACLLCFAVLSSFIVANKVAGEEVVYSVNGKSSGEFLKGEIALDKLFFIDGVSVKLSSDFDIKNKLNHLKTNTVHYFCDGEIENYYFFSNKINNFEIINGKKVNIHVAIKGDSLVVGSPIIYYGY